MIVDSAVYRDGQRAAGPVPLQEALEAAREASGSGFAWIGLVEPGGDELAAVAAEFDLHPLAVEDAVNAHQRPKLEEYGDTLFVVLKTVSYDGSDDVRPGEVMLFVGAHFVVSVRHGPDAGLGDLRRQVESRPEQLCKGPGGVLHAVADLVVDRYAEALARLDERVEDVEDEVFDEHLGVDLSERIYRLKRHVVAFRRAAAPLREPMQRLASPTGVPGIPAEARPFFRDVADHLTREVDHLEALDSLLDSVLDANLAQVQARLNADQRKISSWAAIGLVPTAVAGIYGMNFEHMPELGWTFGYPMALGIIALLCTLLYRGFRRNGWL